MGKAGVWLVGAGVVALGAMIACGSSNSDNGFDATDGGDQGGEAGIDGDGGILQGGEGGAGEGGTIVGDPKDCNDAKTSKSYVGCDYWPTVTANGVWSIFDYAVVVSNVGTAPADITISGGGLDLPDGGAVDGGSPTVAVTVAPGALQKIYLPWVTALKGGDADNCAQPPPIPSSVLAKGGAYHLVSSSPVIVYQFNALEYKGAGGPPGKVWTGAVCPGNTNCQGNKIGCFSFSNDASLLLPSTAMTLNYRVSGHSAVGSGSNGTNTFFTVTATQDATTVTATLGAASQVIASADGTTIPASTGAGTLTFALAKAGDVAEVFGPQGPAADFSGSLVQADKPIQVISGVTALLVPSNVAAADHTEQVVLPVETLGKQYVIPLPDAPGGGRGVGVIRFYGNEDGTTLTYNGSTPAGCPTTLNAGDVVECKIGSVSFITGKITSTDVDVTGDKSFAVALFQEGADAYGGFATTGEGDPSQTVIASVEQFREKYLFLAPTDYDQSYADIVGESDAAPIIDGTPVSATFAPIGSGPYGVWRVTLGAGPKSDGAHTLTSTKPVGLQVVGYGQYTSYQYPGGLNLNQITASPPPPR